jgi:hypothetical protein
LWSSTALSVIPSGLGLGKLFLFIVRARSTFRPMPGARLARSALGCGRSGQGDSGGSASENVGPAGAHQSDHGRGGDPDRSSRAFSVRVFQSRRGFPPAPASWLRVLERWQTCRLDSWVARKCLIHLLDLALRSGHSAG